MARTKAAKGVRVHPLIRLMVIAVIAAAYILVLSHARPRGSRRMLGPVFHIMATFREVVSEESILSESEQFRRVRYVRTLILVYCAWVLYYLMVAALAARLPRKRYSMRAMLAALIAVVLANFLASTAALAITVYPRKIELERLARALSGEPPARAVALAVDYVNASLHNSYLKPESILELNERLGYLDICIAAALGLHDAHIILYQGWGSCGHYAILTSYILGETGYPVRIARFKDRDHAWAEVQINGTWYIVDPWYIGKYYANSLLVPAYKLAEKFHSSGVIVECPNGTRADANAEHGYPAEEC